MTDRTLVDHAAIVGMACRFASAPNLESFWDLLASGRDGVVEYPPGRTPELDRFYGAAGSDLGAPTRRGGFIENVDAFDADFFRISPREAELMDPQQRLLLELAWEAMEDAGLAAERLAGPRTGVFVGVWLDDYGRQLDRTQTLPGVHSSILNALFVPSGRVAFAFDFRGPEVSVNSGCASALSALHQAVAALRAGTCDVAFVGAANLIVRPEVTLAFGRVGVLSRDGRSKFGDDAADGYVRSDGAGMLILKRLSQAEADGDRIHAVVRGSAVNNSGSSSGFFERPSKIAQAEVIRAALDDAELSPSDLQYVEAHGTGTAAGDVVELSALAEVVGRDRIEPCFVGSAKSNIGHTEAAAGIAGIIKTVLALEHRRLPPTLHVKKPNAGLDWPTSGIALNTTERPWPGKGPGRAGVSSFGIAGANAHVIVEEAPAPAQAPEHRSLPAERDAWLLPLSANSPEALRLLASSYAEAIDRGAGLEDLAFTAGARRSGLPYRLAAVAGSGAELAERLRSWSADGAAPYVFDRSAAEQPARPVLVFPGQGSQWLGMGRDLMRREPAFRDAMARCDSVISAEVGWSVQRLLSSEISWESVGIERIQPTLFAIEVALAALWSSWRIRPAVVVGHSMGEIAAAHVAGALSLEDAAAIICRRSALMGRFTGLGAMAMVELAASEAADALVGYEDRVSVAVVNGPRSTVLSGEPAALREIVSRLKAEGVFCRSVSVQVAAHSPQMDLIRDELLESLSGLRPRAGDTPIYSTTLGRFTDGAEFDAGYWVANLRQPVLFHAAVKALMSEGRDVFIEASPHPILLPAIDEMGRDAGSSILTVPSLRRNEPEQATILAGLGQLFAYGEPVDWSGLYRSGRFSDAPRHPWRRRRYWAEMESATPTSAAGGHPLLPPPLRTADHSWIWTTRLSADVLPWLKDHVVRDAALLPASAYVETMVMAAREMIGHPCVVVEGLQLKEAIILSGEQVVQLTLTPERPGRWSAKMHVLDREADAWGLAASAHVLIDRADDVRELEQDEVAGFARAPSAGAISREAHAGFLRALGYDFGRHFQNIEWLAVEGDLVRAVARLDDGLLTTAYGLHPALLDSGLQALMVGLSHRKPGQTLIPSSVERARIFPAARSASTAYILAHSEPGDSLGELGWVRMYGTEGALLAELSGVRFQGFGAREPAEPAPPFWSVDWIPGDLPATGVSIGRWLILADEKGLARSLATELRASGARVDVLTADLLSRGAEGRGELQRAIAHTEKVQLVHLSGLDLPHDASTNQIAAVCAEVAQLATVLSEGPGATLALVSRGACAVAAGEPLSVPSAALWGLGAVIANESPSLSCRMIDLPREPDPGDMMDLAEELLRGYGEPRVALRGGRRLVARLRPHEEEARPAPTRQLYEGERAELVMANPGVLDSLSARRSRRRTPSAGEIEVEVHFAGLNFLDVIRAMDLFDPLAGRISSLGVECAGRVARVGEGVTEFRVGDNVVALSPAFHEAGTLASHLVTRASLAAKVPDGMDLNVAAGAPCVYLTSYLALVEMARVRAGETVLIHSATGGVGLAAIQVARWLGADIVASAGTEAKRAMLRDMGIERVFDSRTPEFAGDVKALTGGRGVDVVLNSLSGGAILEGLAALAPYGRFLEIGKRDMWDNSRIGFGALLSNRSIFGIDLATMIEDQPDRVGVSLRRIMELVGDGTFAPLPITTFPAARAADALHLMAAAKHTGKLVVAMEGVQAPSTSPVRPDGAYLITGGFGALGLVAAEALAEAGAGALVLCGRSAPSARARESIDRLKATGTAVVARSLDIGDEAEVRGLLADISATLPPLRGVVHSAGVLDDALMEDLSAERFRTVLRGKAEGALLLDRLTAGSPLDFFVLFSSVAAVLGSPGQGNYAAANALLDALAEDRAARGQPAQSLAWGPWSEIGLAAADKNRGSRVAERGLHELSPREGRRLFESALAGGSRPYTAIMHFSAERWLEMAAPSTAQFLADVMGRGDGERPALAQPRTPEGKITAAEMKDLLTAQLSAVLRTPADRLGPARPFQSLGLDSLMGLELRNRLERALGWKLSASTVWNFPTVDRLCAHLVARAEAEARSEPSANVERKSAAQALGAELLEAEALLAGA